MRTPANETVLIQLHANGHAITENGIKGISPCHKQQKSYPLIYVKLNATVFGILSLEVIKLDCKTRVSGQIN
jgi:hypothetical protein